MSWYRKEGGAVLVSVRVTPKADRDAFDGVVTLADGRQALKARVRALPESGAANDAVVRLFAASLRQAKSTVSVVAGAGQRMKTIRVAGNTDDLPLRLGAMAASGKPAARAT
jgi:uncharacterized protein (TIGR00251 family)